LRDAVFFGIIGHGKISHHVSQQNPAPSDYLDIRASGGAAREEELREKIRKEKLRGPPKPRPDVFKNRKETRSYTKAQQES